MCVGTVAELVFVFEKRRLKQHIFGRHSILNRQELAQFGKVAFGDFRYCRVFI